MANDKNGVPLYPGDTVTIRATVKKVGEMPDSLGHAPIVVLTVEPSYSDLDKKSLQLSSQQVEKVQE